MLEIYPNPALDISTIKLLNNKAGHVRLLIYDANGKLVEELENKFLNTGKYFYSLNTGNLQPGVYFSVLEAPEIKLTKKLVVK